MPIACSNTPHTAMPPSVFTDDAEERRARHAIGKVRPNGSRCCVPDYLEAKHDTFRLCSSKECGSRGRRTAIGVCRKPQRQGSPRTCFDVLCEFLSEDEREDYERAVRAETSDAFEATQRRVSKTLYTRMRRAFHGPSATQHERRNAVFRQVWKQVTMAGYQKSYKRCFLAWLDKDVSR